MFPKSVITIIPNVSKEFQIDKMEDESVFNLDTLFGKKTFKYRSVYNYDHFEIERIQTTFFTLSPIPLAEIYIKNKNSNEMEIQVIISLSKVWKFFIVLFFILLLAIPFVFAIFRGFTFDSVWIFLKTILAISIMYLIIRLNHFVEKSYSKQILVQLLSSSK